MRRLAIMVAVALAGCGDQALELGDTCHDDVTRNHGAVNPQDGSCWQFASSCEVPPSWEACTPQDGVPPRVCLVDDDCPRAQHCDAGVCADNPQCVSDADCGEGTVCPPESCDSLDPSCVAVGPSGPCLRPAASCVTTDDCAPGDVCPFEYDAASPAVCQLACLDDSTCGEGERCRLDLACAQPRRLLPVCYAWCTP